MAFSRSMYASEFFLKQVKPTVDLNQTAPPSPSGPFPRAMGLSQTGHSGERKRFYFGALVDLVKWGGLGLPGVKG